MTRRHSPVRPAVAALVVVTLLASGCLPESATAEGREVAWLYNVFMAAAAVVFFVVVALLTWSVLRYRGRPGRNAALPAQVHGNLGLEVVWWALPTALVAVLVVLTAVVLSDVDAGTDDPALTLAVDGFQWGWRFTYQEAGVVVAGTAADPPTVYLPVDEPIAFVVTSEDVVHSFNVPAFLFKRDAIPGRHTRFELVIDRAGTYTGQCGEFCGLLHSYQYFTIEAVPRAEFDAWLATLAAEADAEAVGEEDGT